MRPFGKTIRFAQLAASACLMVGCIHTADVKFVGEKDPTPYSADTATSLEQPVSNEQTANDAIGSLSPRTVLDERKDEIWDLSLNDCMQIALQSSRIIRSRSTFLTEGNPILSNVDRTPSIYDPSIQETGVLFGGRGVEAALAAFDTQFSTSAIWGRNETVQNNQFGAGATAGGTLANETARVDNTLSKTFGYGGSLELGHTVNYLGNNVPSNLFDTVYTGNVAARYRHPLLAGSGTEFTRIAGPIGSSFGGLTGVTQGVVIARINNDITLTDLEENVTNMVRDVENTYWDLYLNYRIYDTVVAARNSALRTWHDAKVKRDVGGAPGFTLEDEAQARDQYFETQARAKNALADVYEAESALRRLIGLSVNDGRVIRPSDNPITARYQPDWGASIAEGMTRRVELRRIKWNIKSLELQMLAAENLVRPRLDLVASYQVNGFGDKLLAYNDNDKAGTQQGLNSFYESITQGNQTGWTTGFVFELPIGMRSARAQVRNIELRLTKAREVLAAAELEISHEIGNAFQSTAKSYAVAQSYLNRRNAAFERLRLTGASEKVGKQTIDMVLRSQASLADAEVAYFRAIIAYTQSITNLHFRSGSLLPNSAIYMAESDWEPEAYQQALVKARARSAGLDVERFQHTAPEEFALPLESVMTSAIATTAFPVRAEPLPPETPPPAPAAAPVEPMSVPGAEEKPEPKPAPQAEDAQAGAFEIEFKQTSASGTSQPKSVPTLLHDADSNPLPSKQSKPKATWTSTSVTTTAEAIPDSIPQAGSVTRITKE